MTTALIMSNPATPADACIDPTTEFGKLLAHPRLAEFLRLSLVKLDLQPADHRDLEAQVMAALWRRRLDADPPNNLPRLIALAKTVLEGKVIDFFRHRAVERDNLTDHPAPELDPHGRRRVVAGRDQPNLVDQVIPARSNDPESEAEIAEKMALVQEKLDDGTLTHDDLEVMQAEKAGEKTLAALAEERKVAPTALRKRLQRIRDALKKEWTIRSTPMLVLTIVTVLLLVTLALAMAGRSDPPVPPQRKERTEERSAPRRLAPEDGLQPPAARLKPD